MKTSLPSLNRVVQRTFFQPACNPSRWHWSRLMRMRAIGAALTLLLAALAAPAQEISMTSALVVEGVGSGGRTLVQTDAVDALRVRGEWRSPAEGDTIQLEGGATRAWQSRDAGQDAWLRVRPGGYASWTFTSDSEKVMILEASGHASAMVNAELRVGDPYELGYVRLPVLVKQGANEILLKSGRGRVRAKLVDPPADVFLNLADMTMPDLLTDEPRAPFGAIVVVNATREPLVGASIEARADDKIATTAIPAIPALASRKVRVNLMQPGATDTGEKAYSFAIVPADPGVLRAEAPSELKLAVRRSTDKHKRTFVSDIDGSVQYYAVVPPPPGTDLSQPKALVLSLHGASVEATSQANCYKQRDWCYVVCPTNRRPFGFDWEDWGRTDALEVLAQARKQFTLDDRRTYLTGHSMGGHGTWNIGVQFPGTFAALGPSAGWISFWSYAGGANRDNVSDIEKLLLRATCTSDTLALKQNFAQQGIYILHGDADDNVPVNQARTMRKELAEFHPNFAYYEQPGAGHWWGDQCVDWDPMIEFFRRHVRPEPKDVTRIDFTCVNPAVSATCDWITVQAQTRRHEPSRVEASLDKEKKHATLKTSNVAALSLDLGTLLNANDAVTIEIDTQKLDAAAGIVNLARNGDTWSVSSSPRSVTPALFKSAFANRAMLVYGTAGTPDENAAMLAKARYDAETFWYRGNGAFDVVADTEFDPAASAGRNVILYGNADINRAWDAVLPKPYVIDVRSGHVSVGGNNKVTGDAFACLALTQGSHGATVGVVAATGLPGLRLTDRLPYFVSGVGVLDWVVLTPDLLTKGVPGLVGAGFFGPGGTPEGGESVWTVSPP